MEENDTGEQSSILDLFEILNSVSRLEILTQRMATLVSYLFFKSNDDSERKVDLASLKDSYEDFHKEWISITQSSDTYVKNNKRLFYLIYDDCLYNCTWYDIYVLCILYELYLPDALRNTK